MAQTDVPLGGAASERALSLLDRLHAVLHGRPTLVPVIVLVLSLISFALIVGDRFFSAYNLSLISQQVAIIAILAAAQSLIIITAGIDLSVGAMMVLSYVVMGSLAVGFEPPLFIAEAFGLEGEQSLPFIVALIIGLLLAMACGAMNGFLVTRFKLPPFIVTLGAWNIFLALAWEISGSQSIRGTDIDKTAPMLKFFGGRFEFEAPWGAEPATILIPYLLLLTIATYGVLWYVLNRTAWGRHVYAVGDDKDAAELSGVRTNRTLLSVYIVAGLICGVAAWAAIGRVGAVSPNSFAEANLQSITAVVIGGISLFGGRGSILGPLIGALIVGVLAAGLKMSGVDVRWQLFAIGWLTIIAVAIDQWIRRAAK